MLYFNLTLLINLLLVLMLLSDFITLKHHHFNNEKTMTDEEYLESIKPKKPDQNSSDEEIAIWNKWIEKQCEVNEYKNLYSAWKYHLKDCGVKWEDTLENYKRKYKNK